TLAVETAGNPFSRLEVTIPAVSGDCSPCGPQVQCGWEPEIGPVPDIWFGSRFGEHLAHIQGVHPHVHAVLSAPTLRARGERLAGYQEIEWTDCPEGQDGFELFARDFDGPEREVEEFAVDQHSTWTFLLPEEARSYRIRAYRDVAGTR